MDIDPTTITPPASAGVQTGLQYLATAALSIAVGKEWISTNDAVNIGLGVAALLPAVRGVWKAIKHSKERTALTNGTATIVSK